MKINETGDDRDEAAEHPDHNRPERPESNDAAWGDYRPAENRPDPGKSTEVRSVADLAGLQKVLEYHPMDGHSRAAAADCGLRMAAGCSEADWRQASPEQRERILDRLARDTEESLQLAPHPVDIRQLPPGTVGRSDMKGVELSETLLSEAEVRPALETIAHEYRHVWQREVIDGQREHPLGEAGRLRLTRGLLRYLDDQADLLDYATNGMELDAEAFARRVVSAYEEEQRRPVDEQSR